MNELICVDKLNKKISSFCYIYMINFNIGKFNSNHGVTLKLFLNFGLREINLLKPVTTLSG